MKENKIISLTHKKLTGEITPEELSLLNSLDQNNRVGEVVENIWEASASYSPNVSFDGAKGFSAFQERLAQDAAVNESSPSKWGWWSLVGVIVISCLSYIVYSSMDKEITHYAETAKEEVQLPDGSVIYLSNGASVKYASSFGKDNRDLELKGKAFFDVERNENLQFNISMEEHTVSVLGTAFNLDFDGEEVVLEVSEGKVRFESDEKTATIVANEAIRFDESDKNIQKSIISDPLTFTWATNELSFKNTKLDKVFDILGDYFNVEFNLMDDVKVAANECSFTSPNIKKPVLNEILEVMEATSGVNYSFSKDGKSIDIIQINCK